MAYIKKEIRNKVYKKCEGRCGYCGTEIEYSEMQVDHIKPIKKGGTDKLSNLMPACARCNKWKTVFTVEQFREEIKAQFKRVKRDSSGFRMMLDYNLIEPTGIEVRFYFELLEENNLIEAKQRHAKLCAELVEIGKKNVGKSLQEVDEYERVKEIFEQTKLIEQKYDLKEAI